MDTIRLIRYDDLPENEKAQQPNNGCGKKSAMYLAFEVGKKTVYRSDAMEPEDTRFTRDLAWIQRDLDALIVERDAAIVERDALRDELATVQEHSCAVCGREPDGMSMNTVVLCDRCYEDRIA